MSWMPEPRELGLAAAGLIRASLTREKFGTDRILTRAFEADIDGLFFAFTVANLAGPILALACGTEAQAVALIDNSINVLVRDHAHTAALPLDLGSIPGFGLLAGFGLGLGFAFDPRGIFASGLPFGLPRRDALCGPVRPG